MKNPFFTTIVADDKLTFRGFLAEFFKSEGHFIIRAESAQQVVNSTRKFQPDMILLNNQLGDVNCLSLIPELLVLEPKAALIVMAFKSSIAEAVESIRRGAVDYLQRPLDASKIREAIAMQKALLGIQ